MKKCFLLFLIPFLFIPSAKALEIKSNNAVLYNLNDDKILINKNKDEKASIASLTKLMTALVAIERIDDLDKKVSFVKNDYENLEELDASGSSMKHDKKYSYRDLLYGLILESGADCANALARLTYENNDNFVKTMNDKSKALGLKNTSFANPIGLDDKNNYSTVDEVATILKEVLKNDVLNEIIKTKEYTLSDGTKIKHTLKWYSEFLKEDLSFITASKTGYETDSGYALASVAEKDNVKLLLITTNGMEKFDHIEDAKNIYKYYFNNYSYHTIIKKGYPTVTLNTKYLSKDKIDIHEDKDINVYIENNYNKDDIKTVYKGIKTLTLDNKKGSTIGTLEIYYKDELIKEDDVILNQRLYPDFKLIAAALGLYTLIIGTTATIIKRKKALN